MEQRRLGSTGLYVSRLALGTMTWGRDTDEDDASSQLKAFVEGGGTLIHPAALDLGIGVLPWSPLGRGVLTGKYRTGTPADSRAASPDYERFIAPYLDD